MSLLPGNKKLKQINGKTGEVETELVGGERIFSIPDTAKLVKLAKAADDDELLLIKLGKAVAEAIQGQEERPEEYTDE